MDGPVLVIDDDPSILDTVADILEFEGYRVITARNGAEGLQALQHERPSVILLDMRMPVLDGWAFARAIAEQELHVPVLVMTAAQDAGRWAREIDASGFLAKPFNLIELLEAVRTAGRSS
jgi:two-component system, chemotaxis family, chemotaxis protein CheY